MMYVKNNDNIYVLKRIQTGLEVMKNGKIENTIM